jgi:ubiquinone/menaquinone biosynthesis C-methylase UbiE
MPSSAEIRRPVSAARSRSAVLPRPPRSVPRALTAIESGARELSFGDGTFDAMYLVTALGEIPEPDRVLSEAVRVLTPHGRLVVGEFFERHWIPFGRLHRLARLSSVKAATAPRAPC